MIVLDCAQGSHEWFKARLGIPTASEFSKIMTPAKCDYSRSATTYMHKLIAERLTGKEATGFTSEWMERGKEMESEARSWYEFTKDVKVKQVGFVYRDERKHMGCSPDSLVSDFKGLEIKCPSPGVMVGYMLNRGLPLDYKLQVHGSMMVCGPDFHEWDFLAYHPDFDPLLITVKRNDDFIRQLEINVARFLKEMNEKIERIKQ